MKIRTKLTLSSLLVAIFIGVVGWFGYTATLKINDSFNLVKDQTVPTLIALHNIKSSTLRTLSATVEVVFIENETVYIESNEEVEDEGKYKSNHRGLFQIET